MEILDYFESDRQARWLEQIGKSDWSAGQFLYSLLREGRLKELCGESTQVLLLTEGDRLLAFCTYAERDDIQPTGLRPWLGFAYTFPAYRGRRLLGRLLDRAAALAREQGFPALYISTNHIGLYERYGCVFDRVLNDIHGEPSRVYRRDVL